MVYILDFEPKEIVIYLGKNDINDNLNYSVDQALEYYDKIL